MVALAPLTNIATALKLDPDFGKKLKECVIMGGNIEGQLLCIYFISSLDRLLIVLVPSEEIGLFHFCYFYKYLPLDKKKTISVRYYL